MDTGRRINLDEINSEEFVKRLRSQDAAAFDTFCVSILPKIAAYLSFEYDLSEADVDELVSDALLKVYKALPMFTFNKEAKLSTWAFRIAKNTTLDFLRKRSLAKSRVEMIEMEAEAGAAAAGHQTVLDWHRNEKDVDSDTESDEGDAMLRAFKTISEQDQDILRLRNCMEYEDIAAVEGSEEGSLRTRYSRALKRLKDAYKMEKSDEG